MKKIYLIGIGGIGISALARYYLSEGAKIIGSDLSSNETTEKLIKEGAQIFIGPHQSKHLPDDINLVVYSAAVPKDNPERQKALQLQTQNNQLEILSYPQALGKISQQYFTIAVSGTHGKSTTVAMTSLILMEAGLDPTIFIGTKLKEFPEGNFRKGKSRYLVLEADEWQASFLNYYPQILVITNIEEEHLDFYKDIEDILQTYQKAIDRLPQRGILIINNDSPSIRRLKIRPDIQVLKYSHQDPLVAKLQKILKVPGDYNLRNALASFYIGRSLNLSDQIIFQGLEKYQGCWRRFDQRSGILAGRQFTLVYDYAHHPTALAAFLQALREKFPQKKIIAIFQPHQYERTWKLLIKFIDVLKKSNAWVDQLILTDIYEVAGREKEAKQKINAQLLAKKTQSTFIVFQPLANLSQYLKQELQGGEIVAVIGAGNIYEWGKSTLEKK